MHKTTITPGEKSCMELVARLKGGELLRRDTQLYYVHPGNSEVHVYDNSLLDFLLEWGNTPLELDKEQLAVVQTSGQKNSIPVRCEFKNGRVYDYCELKFFSMPPPANWFQDKKPEWHYLNAVRKIELSHHVVPKIVRDEIARVEKHNNRILEKIKKLEGNLLENPDYDRIRSQITAAAVMDKSGRLFKFSKMESFVYSPFIDAQTFVVLKNPTREQIEKAQELSLIDYNERGNDKPPFATVYIIADA